MVGEMLFMSVHMCMGTHILDLHAHVCTYNIWKMQVAIACFFFHSSPLYFFEAWALIELNGLPAYQISNNPDSLNELRNVMLEMLFYLWAIFLALKKQFQKFSLVTG